MGCGALRGDPERFDTQAGRFDRRAGLGSDASRAVAEGVLEIAALQPDDLLVEIGAGTGEVGRRIAETVGYLGMDRSGGMLREFRARVGEPRAFHRTLLVQADGEEGWPVRDGAAGAVLAVRVSHLLEPAHVMAEVTRVCRPGAVFLIGRVKRDPDSPRSRLRHRRQQLLRERGLGPRRGELASGHLLDQLVARGASRLPSRTVASWSATTSVDAVLRGWEEMASMGGSVLPAAARAEVIAQLRAWAVGEFGDLARVGTSTERFVLDGVRLPEPAAAGRRPQTSSAGEARGTAWTTRC